MHFQRATTDDSKRKVLNIGDKNQQQCACVLNVFRDLNMYLCHMTHGALVNIFPTKFDVFHLGQMLHLFTLCICFSTEQELRALPLLSNFNWIISRIFVEFCVPTKWLATHETVRLVLFIHTTRRSEMQPNRGTEQTSNEFQKIPSKVSIVVRWLCSLVVIQSSR